MRRANEDLQIDFLDEDHKMQRHSLGWVLVAVLLVSAVSVAQQTIATQSVRLGSPAHGQISSSFGKLPLTFEANQGQTSTSARFVARGNGYSAFLTAGGMVLSLRPEKVPGAPEAPKRASAQKTILQFNLLGAAQNPTAVGEDEQPGRVNYFLGKDPKRWHTNVPTYARVRYKNVYPGIDLIYYGNHRQLEYDFQVSRGADPNLIRFEIKGANQLRLDGNGDLTLTVSGGELHFKSPIVYQQINGQRRPIDGGYAAQDATHISFHLADYDHKEPIVIDPVLVYSTYLGGSGDDEPRAIAIDGDGSIYVAGDTDSADFPGTTVGVLDFGLAHAFVAKLDPTGANLVYADYLGGDGGDWGAVLALDSTNNVYLAGNTSSDNFPTVNSYQASLVGIRNTFVSKISSDGSTLLYSTYLAGNGWDTPTSVAIDAAGDAFVAGMTSSTNFPMYNAFQSVMSPNQNGDYGNYAFLTEFSPKGSSLIYSTYLGGSLTAIATCWNGPCWLPPFSRITGLTVDTSDNVYVAGYTVASDFPTTSGAYLGTDTTPGALVGFVGKFNAAGGLAYSTYLYGNGGAGTEIEAIAVDSSGSAYVAGSTISDGTFPVTSTSICDPGISGLGCNYTFVTKLDAAGASLLYSTFLGPNNNAAPQAIALDANNNAYILGMSWGCTPFGMVNGIEPCLDQATSALLLVEIDPSASTELFATYLGGTDDEYPAGIALDSAGNIYVGAETFSSDFPATAGAFRATLHGRSNAFLLKIAPDSAPAFSASSFLLEYGSQLVGSTSPATSATIRNMGSAPLSISSITVSGDFTQTNDCGSNVPAASSCIFSVSFAPTAAGTRSGSIVIQDDAAGSPHTINLSGYAPGAIVALTPGSVTFLSQSVGTSSGIQSVTLGNSGDMDLMLGNFQVTGDFAQTNNCPVTLSASSSCVIKITFTPSAPGTRTGALVFSDNAQSPQTLSLSGVGADFTLTSSAPNETATPGTAATYHLTIAPLGGSFSSSVGLTCSGLPAQASCGFSPSAVTPGGSAATATVTLYTTASTAAAGHPRLFETNPLYAIWIPLQGMGLFGMIFAGSRRPSKKWSSVVLLGLMIALLLFATGCAGVSDTLPRPGTGSGSGTAPGSYSVTVTGTSGTLQHSVNLVLTVQ